jgi:peptidoglycan-N-acetylglucosamine deacetylase
MNHRLSARLGACAVVLCAAMVLAWDSCRGYGQEMSRHPQEEPGTGLARLVLSGVNGCPLHSLPVVKGAVARGTARSESSAPNLPPQAGGKPGKDFRPALLVPTSGAYCDAAMPSRGITIETPNSSRVLAAAATDQSPSRGEVTKTFGAQTILERCWTSEQLLGKPDDLRTARQHSTARAMPQVPPGPLRSLAPLAPEVSNSIRSVEMPSPDNKLLALTFDLCEANGGISGYDAELVNTLRTHQVKATFFAGGKWMRSHPDKTQQLMADPLFEIGNHSWSHAHFALIDETEMQREISLTQAQYEVLREDLQAKECAREAGPLEMDKIARTPRLFRFPYGTCSSAGLRLVNQCGLAAIQWSVVTGDAAKSQTAANIARVVFQQARPGAIIVAHANGRGHGTAAALARIIPQLRANGYQFVTVSELLASGKPISVTECYENRPRDNRRYDAKASRRNR